MGTGTSMSRMRKVERMSPKRCLNNPDVDKHFEEAPTPKQSGADDTEDVADHEITCPYCGKVFKLAEI